MAINFNNIGSGQIRDQNRPGQTGDAARSASDTTKGPGNQDRVELSQGAQVLQTLASEVSDLPAVDTARVDDIRRAIAEGRYHVDPVRLAQKFLELENDL
jgi:negative regulator of flagellin synthesis FlgM